MVGVSSLGEEEANHLCVVIFVIFQQHPKGGFSIRHDVIDINMRCSL